VDGNRDVHQIGEHGFDGRREFAGYFLVIHREGSRFARFLKDGVLATVSPRNALSIREVKRE